jgi:hypothetical protein
MGQRPGKEERAPSTCTVHLCIFSKCTMHALHQFCDEHPLALCEMPMILASSPWWGSGGCTATQQDSVLFRAVFAWTVAQEESDTPLLWDRS